MQVGEELLVGPFSSLEDEEGVVGILASGMVFEDMVGQLPVLCHDLGDITESRSGIEGAGSEVMADQESGIEVSGGGCGARNGGGDGD